MCGNFFLVLVGPLVNGPRQNIPSCIYKPFRLWNHWRMSVHKSEVFSPYWHWWTRITSETLTDTLRDEFIWNKV